MIEVGEIEVPLDCRGHNWVKEAIDLNQQENDEDSVQEELERGVE